MSNPDHPVANANDANRLSWAAYFGAVTGLFVGIGLSMVLAYGLYHYNKNAPWAEYFWEIASPLLAILGFLAGGYLFHRCYRNRIYLPAIFCLIVLAVVVFLATGPIGFPWKI